MLGPRQVLIVLARPEAILDGAGRAAALAILTDDERARLDRFRFDRDRDVALASRAVQRRTLSRCVDAVAPSAWRFTAGADLRPQITGPVAVPALSWNVANTVGLVACAVTLGRELGVDVEAARRDAPAEIVESHFAAAEQAALRALPPAQQPRRFVELWTLKEAYVKARSLGLTLPLARFGFDPASTPPGFTIDAELADAPGSWQVAQWWPTPTHALAVCVRNDDGPALSIVVAWDDQAAPPAPR